MSVGYKKTRKNKRYLILFFTFIFVCTCAFSFTQLLVSAFDSGTLGKPLFGNTFSPWKGFVWWYQAGGGVVLYNPLTAGNTSLHGTAKWANFRDIKKSGLLDHATAKNSVIVGGLEKAGRTHYLYHKGPEHILCFAPSRSGKGVSLVLPTLFSWLESAVVLDVKGESWALSAGWRRNHAKNKVLKFDPTATGGEGARFNPLSEIRINTQRDVSDAQQIAYMVVDPEGIGLVDHWQKTSYALLTGVFLHLVYKYKAIGLGTPSLPDVVEFVSEREPRKGYLAEMASNEFYNGTSHPVVLNAANDMLNREPREFSGVQSTMISNLTLYRDPIVASNISTSDFTLEDLMNHEKPVSLYLVLRPSDKERLTPLIRLVVALLTTRLTSEMEFEDGRNVPHYKHKLLLLLDEFAALRQLNLFEQQLPFLAGYGIKCYIIIQDLKQLYKLYSKNENITSNSHIKIAFNTNEQLTCQYLSTEVGETTVVKKVVSGSGSRWSPMYGRVSRQMMEVKRPLLMPDEVRRMRGPVKSDDGSILEPGEMLIFMAGHNPIRGTQSLYFLDETFSARAKVKPPVSTDSLR